MNLEEYLHMLHEMERRNKQRRHSKDAPPPEDGSAQRR
jgi:hypothetical protein